MTYVSDDDVEERVGGLALLVQLTDDAHLGSVDYEILDHFIARNVGKVEAWLSGVEIVPITDPVKLARIAGPLLDLISYDLKARRDTVSAPDLQQYTDAVKFFETLGGKMASLSDKGTGTGRLGIQSETPLTFKRDTMRGF